MEMPQSVVVLSLTAFCFFVGLPVWWQTTKVYRAPLPYNEISSLAEAKSNFHKVRLQWSIFLDPAILQSNGSRFVSFQKSFRPLADEKLASFNLQIVYKQLLLNASVVDVPTSNFKTVQALIDHLHKSIEDQMKEITEKHKDALHHNIIFVRMPHHLSKRLDTKHALLLGTSHVIVLVESVEPDELEKAAKWILSKMQEILYPILNKYTGINKWEHEAKETSFQSSTGLDISFTLANANYFSSFVDWNIETAICNELMPFLQKISDFGPFSITSQTLNFFDMGLEPKKLKDSGYFHSLKNLSLLINPLESHLTEYTSNKPILKFVLLIPEVKHTPLMFRHKGMSYKSFTSPRWGSVIIKNLDSGNEYSKEAHNSQDFKSRKLEIESDMKIVVLHFRELIGLKRKPSEGVFFASLGKSAVASWEIDYLLLKRTLENLKKSVSNLISLAGLLGKIANIVIRNDIQMLLEKAAKSIKESRFLLTQGQIRKSFLASKSAVLCSEKAFYDHSLLALLYFPDDQKYAIYLPLFFPIFVPLLITFISAIKTIYSNHYL